MTRIIIAGGRDFEDYEYLARSVDRIIESLQNPDIEIVSGRAKGADTLGEKYAAEHGLPTKLFPANWKGLGKKAGFIRNHQMGDYADILIAFWDHQSHGTKDMIDYMKSLGKKTHVFPYYGPRAKEAAYEAMLEYWSDPSPEPWTNPDLIREIPVVRDEYLWKDVILPGIIKRGGIPKSSLEVNHVYQGSCRNASEALWDGEEFRYRRYKFGWYIDTIEHFEDNPPTDVFVPIHDLGEADEDDSRRI